MSKKETNPQKVLIDVERLKYPKSGIANVCVSLIKGLDEIKQTFDYAFYGPQKNIPKTKTNFRIIKWKFWQKYIPVNTSSFSLIHTTHQQSEYFQTIEKNQKRIVTLHDLNFLHDNSSERKKKKLIRLIQRNIGNADSIVCISEFVKNDFLLNKHLFSLKNDVKTEVIYNGLIFPEKLNFKAQKEYGFISRKYILNIGVLFPKKNQTALLDLISGNDRDLVLITSSSKSEYKQQFLDKVKTLKLENRVHIIENASDFEKYYLIQHCESYCHPSLAEGFGIPPVEAMYFGKPVFLSRLTSLPEIGSNLAFYFDNFNREDMCKVYKDGMDMYNASEDEYAEKLKNRANNFDYKAMSDSYQKLYKSLL